VRSRHAVARKAHNLRGGGGFETRHNATLTDGFWPISAIKGRCDPILAVGSNLGCDISIVPNSFFHKGLDSERDAR
jgi:hypothetical protein